MKVTGERSFAASREEVWFVLNDPASMAKSIPGVDSFDVQDDRHWRAKVKIPLSLGMLHMAMNMEKTEERKPEFASLAVKGTGVGAILNMTTAFTLAEAGHGTRMTWEADVRLAGPVGSMGQHVLQPIVNQQVEHVLSVLDQQVMARGSEPGDSAGGASGTAGAEHPATDATAPPASELKDYGEPAESSPEPEPETGSSGADEGVAPLAPETYEPKPEGPTTSTED
ncbi:MAG TPA: SRPBCC domain-containing protein [Gaiellaceae bacterium]